MTDKEVADAVLLSIRALLDKLPTAEARKEAIGFLLLVSLKVYRSNEGDEFVRGWLTSALGELDDPERVTLQ